MSNYHLLQYINNSALSFINPEEGGNPGKYRTQILGETERKDESYFTLGTNLHFVFLEDIEPVIVKSYPSDVVKGILDQVIGKLKYAISKSVTPVSILIKDYTTDLVKVARTEKYQNKWGDPAVAKEILKRGSEYWKILLTAGDVPIVTEKQHALIMAIRAQLALRPAIQELLSTKKEEHIEYFTELDVIWEEHYTGNKMKCKSKLDRVRLDHKSKTFSIRDFKSTGKPLESFSTSFEMYRYYRQIKFYEDAFMFELKKRGLDGYRPGKHFIVAAETGAAARMQSFIVTPPFLFKGELEIERLLQRISKHTQESQWIFSIEETMHEHFSLIPNSY